MLGHGLAYGSDRWGFVGTSGFVFSGSHFDDDIRGRKLAGWFFQWAFAGECFRLNVLTSTVHIRATRGYVILVMPDPDFGKVGRVDLVMNGQNQVYPPVLAYECYIQRRVLLVD